MIDVNLTLEIGVAENDGYFVNPVQEVVDKRTRHIFIKK